SHLDLAWNALNWNRDLTRSVAEIRRSEAGVAGHGRALNTVAFPEMRRGEVAVCLATVLARASSLGEALLDYRTQEIACAMAKGQLAYYRIMESQGIMRMLKDWRSVEAHLSEWKETQGRAAPLGFILSMEGADPIISPNSAAEWWEDGLRVVGLAHFGVSAYAHGTRSTGGLTERGRDLLRAMEEVGMVLDITHLSDQSFWEAVDIFKGPVLASHNNCRSFVPGDRQLSDDQIRYLIGRGSVIGAVCDLWMLYPGWVKGKTPNSVVTLEAVTGHIDHVCQLAGNSLHAAIGSDLDGGFGTDQCPGDLETIADLQKIPNLLRNKGYKETDIEAIMHGNWLRFFKTAWAHRSTAALRNA
ncbi:MAG: dipeptidase, partial [Terriglobia bacterium]